MILFFTTACIAGGFLLGRYISRGHGGSGSGKDREKDAAGSGSHGSDGDDGRDDHDEGEELNALADKIKRGDRDAKTRPNAKPSGEKAPARDPFVGFVCRLGDVVMRSGGDEAWLAGAVVFDEATLTGDGSGSGNAKRGVDAHGVAALFVAPEAGADVLLYVRAESGASVWWMHALKDGELVMGAEPPSSLEHNELRFERRRRLPLYASRVGTGAPDVGTQVIVAEYGSGGYEQLLVIAGAGQMKAYRGIALETGMYEVIPSGASTLDS